MTFRDLAAGWATSSYPHVDGERLNDPLTSYFTFEPSSNRYTVALSGTLCPHCASYHGANPFAWQAP